VAKAVPSREAYRQPLDDIFSWCRSPHHRLVHAPLPHLAQVDADGATDIRDLDNLWLSVQKIERKIHSESCGVAIGSRCLLFFLSLV
jgi:hypothetical protein